MHQVGPLKRLLDPLSTRLTIDPLHQVGPLKRLEFVPSGDAGAGLLAGSWLVEFPWEPAAGGVARAAADFAEGPLRDLDQWDLPAGLKVIDRSVANETSQRASR